MAEPNITPNTTIQAVSEGEAMKIDLLTDRIIMENKFKRVDNPILFESEVIPTVGGLFSSYIFGTTQEERMKTFGYIDLKMKFFHPYVYEVLCKLMPGKIEKIAKGEGSWVVINGKIEAVSEESPGYDEDNTGLQWLIEHYDEIKLDPNKSLIRNQRLQFLKNIKGDEFITKWIVCPPFYRDIDLSKKPLQIPEINRLYQVLIKYTNSLNVNSPFAFMNNLNMFKIQDTLVSIRRYTQSLIELKNGHFRKAVIGKNVDRGARSVISVPVITEYDRPDEMPIDIFHTGIPLSQCLVLGYPFILKWVTDFFRNEFENAGVQYPVYVKTGEKTYRQVYKELDNPSEIFTADYIKKKIDNYISTIETRFEPIEVPLLEKDNVYYMSYRGRWAPGNALPRGQGVFSSRPLTWTDVFYMAAYNTVEGKIVYITRYPLEDYFGTFPSLVHVLSTEKTVQTIIDDELYKYYPLIDMSLSKQDISTKFIDTVTMSNMYLQGLGGDYDGDMVTEKVVFTIEANDEGREILQSMKHFISIKGSLVRVIKNEAYLAFYNMTKF